MTHKEIRELLLLKEWKREELAEKLGIARNTIDKWFCVRADQLRRPSPEQLELMRQWLAEAREEVRKQPA